MSKISKLKCRYVHNDHPFLLIGPVKEEHVSLKPHVVIYHDVVTEQQTSRIKQDAFPSVIHRFVILTTLFIFCITKQNCVLYMIIDAEISDGGCGRLQSRQFGADQRNMLAVRRAEQVHGRSQPVCGRNHAHKRENSRAVAS